MDLPTAARRALTGRLSIANQYMAEPLRTPVALISHPDCGRHDTGWEHPEHVGRLVAIPRALKHDLSLFEHRQGVDSETMTLIAINLIAEHLVGLYLRDASDGEWERARPLVADFFGLSQANLSDLVDDMLYRIEMRKAA